jgi:hypothetical protein
LEVSWRVENKGVCPRCKGKGVDIGTSIFNVGRTRAIRLTTYNCAKCNLVFFEKAEE